MAHAAKGWFSWDGHPGDRTLTQQLVGLDDLIEAVPGKTVLDLGCAEGLIAIELARAGAAHVHGVDVLERHIAGATAQMGNLPLKFTRHDLNILVECSQYDIVLMLAICHKLKDPSAFAAWYGRCAREMVVVRLPPATAPVVIDSRSQHQPHDIKAALESAGLKLDWRFRGSFDEWIGYFRRA